MCFDDLFNENYSGPDADIYEMLRRMYEFKEREEEKRFEAREAVEVHPRETGVVHVEFRFEF